MMIMVDRTADGWVGPKWKDGWMANVEPVVACRYILEILQVYRPIENNVNGGDTTD